MSAERGELDDCAVFRPAPPLANGVALVVEVTHDDVHAGLTEALFAQQAERVHLVQFAGGVDSQLLQDACTASCSQEVATAQLVNHVLFAELLPGKNELLLLKVVDEICAEILALFECQSALPSTCQTAIEFLETFRKISTKFSRER